MPPDDATIQPPGGGYRKKRGRYRIKCLFDEWLRLRVGGKYKKKRYKLFAEYLMAGGNSKEQAEIIIKRYQASQDVPLFESFRNELLNWIRNKNVLVRKTRAKKAAAKRWEKPKPAVKHPKTAPKHLKSAAKHSKPAVKHLKSARKHKR